SWARHYTASSRISRRCCTRVALWGDGRGDGRRFGGAFGAGVAAGRVAQRFRRLRRRRPLAAGRVSPRSGAARGVRRPAAGAGAGGGHQLQRRGQGGALLRRAAGRASALAPPLPGQPRIPRRARSSPRLGSNAPLVRSPRAVDGRRAQRVPPRAPRTSAWWRLASQRMWPQDRLTATVPCSRSFARRGLGDVAAAARGSASSRRAPTWRPPAAAWDRTAAPDDELHERAQRARQRQPVAVAPAPAELARPDRRAHLQDEGGCHGSEELFHSRDWSRYLLVGRPQLEPGGGGPLVRRRGGGAGLRNGRAGLRPRAEPESAGRAGHPRAGAGDPLGRRHVDRTTRLGQLAELRVRALLPRVGGGGGAPATDGPCNALD